MSLVYLDGQQVSHDVIDPAKHRFIGTFRPPQCPDARYTKEDGTVAYADVIGCRCGQDLWSVEQTQDHWRQGHFDIPQYVTMEGAHE